MMQEKHVHIQNVVYIMYILDEEHPYAEVDLYTVEVLTQMQRNQIE